MGLGKFLKGATKVFTAPFNFMSNVMGGLAEPIIGGIGSVLAADQSNKAAKEVAKKQINWERERALNAHQWEIADLKAAGLNPILSAGGQGAQTSGINPPMPDTSGYKEAGTRAVGALVDIMNSAKAVQEIKAIKAGIMNTEADTAVKTEQALNTKADTVAKERQAGLIGAQTAKTEMEKIKAEFEAKFAPEILEAERQKGYASAYQAHETAKTQAKIREKIENEIEKLKHEAEGLKRQNKKAELNVVESRIKFYSEVLSNVIPFTK